LYHVGFEGQQGQPGQPGKIWQIVATGAKRATGTKSIKRSNGQKEQEG
jgi:hypothetical protein